MFFKTDPNNIKFVVRNEKGEYWSRYDLWTDKVVDAHLYSRVGDAKNSMARRMSKAGCRIEKVEVVLNSLDTVFNFD